MFGTSQILRMLCTPSSWKVKEKKLISHEGKNPTTLYFPEGEFAGSEGGKAQFEGRVVVIQVDSLS